MSSHQLSTLSTIAFSGLRFYYLWERLHEPESEGMHYKLKAVMWSIIEINTSITVISLPTLMPIGDWCLDVYHWLFGKMKTLDEHMAKNASHGIEVTNGMLLRKTRPGVATSLDEYEMEHLPAEEGLETAGLLPQQPPQLSRPVSMANGQHRDLETRSVRSLQAWGHPNRYRITNP